jgi:hypothetical protein
MVRVEAMTVQYTVRGRPLHTNKCWVWLCVYCLFNTATPAPNQPLLVFVRSTCSWSFPGSASQFPASALIITVPACLFYDQFGLTVFLVRVPDPIRQPAATACIFRYGTSNYLPLDSTVATPICGALHPHIRCVSDAFLAQADVKHRNKQQAGRLTASVAILVLQTPSNVLLTRLAGDCCPYLDHMRQQPS